MTRSLAALWRLAPAPRTRLIRASALGALTVIFGVGLMALAGYLISRAAERPAILSLMVAIAGVRFFGLGRPIVRYCERLASHDVALRVLGRVRMNFYARIEPLAPAQLDGYREGDLLSRMVADVDALQNLYLRGLQPALVALLAGAASVGIALAVLPAAGLVLAVGLVAGAVVVPGLAGFLGARARSREAGARGRLTAEVVEVLGAAPELLVYGADGAAVERVRVADRALVKLAHRDAGAAGTADAAALAITGLTACGVLGAAAAASGAGHLDRVLIAMLALLALASFEAITPLSAAARELCATLAAGRRILELTAQDATVRDPVQPASEPQWPFTVAFEGVRARYPHQPRPALDGTTFRVEPGEHVALLGASGAGKSTIANVLLRFLDPETGRVTLAGRDLREYRQADVRKAISLAGQDSHLFSASIRDNVALARPDATDLQIEQALRRAQLSEWVRGLPDGIHTPVGEAGRQLSGGQRQRLVLARALLAGAPVLVLDEPTAHLDPGTAEELIRDVLYATREQTVLLITHRSEGLDLVDRVITLESPTS